MARFQLCDGVCVSPALSSISYIITPKCDYNSKVLGLEVNAIEVRVLPANYFCATGRIKLRIIWILLLCPVDSFTNVIQVYSSSQILTNVTSLLRVLCVGKNLLIDGVLSYF
jgi:hypothetical protein